MNQIILLLLVLGIFVPIVVSFFYDGFFKKIICLVSSCSTTILALFFMVIESQNIDLVSILSSIVIIFCANLAVGMFIVKNINSKE